MTRVLLIGDSICMGYSNGPGYGSFVGELLGFAVTARASEQSGTLLKQLNAILGNQEWDVIHANCGLHDLKRDRGSGRVQTPVTDYATNVARLLDRLREAAPMLIWATITPVDDELHQSYKPFDRREADVQAYNAAALEAVRARGIAVNDLHAVVSKVGTRSIMHTDGVHYTDDGSKRLAQHVADAIRSVSPRR